MAIKPFGSSSFKVIRPTFCTNRKPAGDFLLVNDTNLYPNLTPFARYRGFRCQQGVSLFNALVRGKFLNAGLRNWPHETREIALW